MNHLLAHISLRFFSNLLDLPLFTFSKLPLFFLTLWLGFTVNRALKVQQFLVIIVLIAMVTSECRLSFCDFNKKNTLKGLCFKGRNKTICLNYVYAFKQSEYGLLSIFPAQFQAKNYKYRL